MSVVLGRRGFQGGGGGSECWGHLFVNQVLEVLSFVVCFWSAFKAFSGMRVSFCDC